MEGKKIKVLFASSECSPIAKVGGLGDVIGSLPKELKKLGIDVRICLPKYGIIDTKKYKFKKISFRVVENKRIDIYQGFLPGSFVLVYLLENQEYFGQDGIYFERTAFVDSFKEIERFLFFSKAVLEVFGNFRWRPQIIHCHDWHSAIIPLLLKIKNQKLKVKSLLTIHNLANQGKWRAEEILQFLKLKENEYESLKIKDKDGDFNILQQGILNADLINTVSPTYAKEILTKKFGQGLEKDLLKRKKDLFGILNGIDQEQFNPQTDPNLKSNYSYKNLEKKKENKIELQRILNFLQDPNIPLFGFIGRLTPQKGIDLIIKILPRLIRNNFQFVCLGIGSADYEKKITKLSQKFPRNISSQIKFDPGLAQKIYAGSDFLLIPSSFEPCGLVQMIAMRYGTLPIARKVGGLSDTIIEKKTGFLFKNYHPNSFWKAIKRAVSTFKNKERFLLMQKMAMRQDFSWKRSAKKYLILYKKLINQL